MVDVVSAYEQLGVGYITLYLEGTAGWTNDSVRDYCFPVTQHICHTMQEGVVETLTAICLLNKYRWSHYRK